MTDQELYAEFQRLGIHYEVVEHPAVFTVEESQRICGDIPGAHVKNLLLRNKKNEFWLLCALQSTKVDIKELGVKIGSGRLSFANPVQLKEMLGLEPGSVSALAVVNDTGNYVKVVLESRILSGDTVNFHPLRNDATVRIAISDLLRFLDTFHHEPVEVEL